MAAHFRDDLLYGRDHLDTHASDNRWRHQESAAFAHHADRSARANARGSSNDLAEFLNASRVDAPDNISSTAARSTPIVVPGSVQPGSQGPYKLAQHEEIHNGNLHVKCGPLLNYRRMEHETWFGSVLVVTSGGGKYESIITPELRLRIPGPVLSSHLTNGAVRNGDSQDGGPSASPLSNGVPVGKARVTASETSETRIGATRLYSDPSNTFWRFDLQIPMQQLEMKCEYAISGLTFQGKKTDRQTFYIPAMSESMRIMFHSCNGFSVGTDEAAWSGPALWNDVLRVHKETPFHVMIGGGDQIYNDGIRVDGPLRKWTDMGNPLKRKEYPFPEDLRKECDKYYVNNYLRWYATEPFASANGSIAQLNLWDDHDIIDGFGSYVDEFMKCSVFRGIGGVALKYYLLFQHHLPPPPFSYTTDTIKSDVSNPFGVDQRQLENTYVLKEEAIDSSYIIGSQPGPYVVDHSRSIYARLGKSIAFFGIDARTERTRRQVNYPDTYQIIFSRLRAELGAASNSASPIRHLIVLLGIPIAYPRLTWLENVFTSPVMAPIKFLNKRFGFGGGFFNHFDGSVDLLDDLDDHYTARTHKKERLFIVQQLQELSSEYSARITILGGDVHLAAVGRFYSNPKLNVPIQHDHRYMANIISSAIVNKPPPQAVANLLARRNKIHHLDQETDETLLKFFDKDPGKAQKTASSNHTTMPSRNWAMITENALQVAQPLHSNGTNGYGRDHQSNGYVTAINLAEHVPERREVKDGHSWLGPGEPGAGTEHAAADMERHGKESDGSLHVCIRVEKDQHDASGRTELYGMSIPLLDYQGAAEITLKKRDAVGGAINERI